MASEATSTRRASNASTHGDHDHFRGIEGLPPQALYSLLDPKSPQKLYDLGGVSGIAAKLGTDTNTGLEGKEDIERLARSFGPNRLPPADVKTIGQMIMEAAADETLILLAVAAVVQLAVGIWQHGAETGWLDGVAVLVAVVFVIGITVVNDYQQEKQFRVLNDKKSDYDVNVVRGGTSHVVSVHDLVVGDIVQLNTGDVIPADGILTQNQGITTDESAATGESQQIKKRKIPDTIPPVGSGTGGAGAGTGSTLPPGTFDGVDPFLLSGTLVAAGTGRMLVVAVGVNSFNGRIMLTLRTAAPETPLQEKLGVMAKRIGWLGLAAALFILTAQVIKYFVLQSDAEGGLDAGDAVENVVAFAVIAVSIVVVAVPEGLPLAVTVALAYSMKHMMRDKNLVRHLDASETMGGVTTVCSDKTGTLTTNQMTVVAGNMFGLPFGDTQVGSRLPTPRDAASATGHDEVTVPGSTSDASDNDDGAARRRRRENVSATTFTQAVRRLANHSDGAGTVAAIKLLCEGIAVNSTAFEGLNERTDRTEFVGSQTECAMLRFLQRMHGDGVTGSSSYNDLRRAKEPVQQFPFSSELKRMSTIVEASAPGDGGNDVAATDVVDAPGPDWPRSLNAVGAGCQVLHCKGASEIVLGMCSRRLTSGGDIVPLSDDDRATLLRVVDEMAHGALRTLCLAVRFIPHGNEPRDFTLDEEPNLVCLGLIGIRDPPRPEVPNAVAQCLSAGVTVRMVTGDNATTAVSIARSVGIIPAAHGSGGEDRPQGLVMEGPAFRRLSDAERRKLVPTLRVLARSSPTDKLLLVRTLQGLGEVVAVTGDGVNDAPALKNADVGFSMGLSGTEVAKEASAIVLLDDNFASIVSAIKWGRNVFGCIRKFINFQLTTNFSAILFIFIAILADSKGGAESAPLQPVQLLWVNLIMDSFAAIALATEPPFAEQLLADKPYGRHEALITPFMWRSMASQVVMQTITFLVVLYSGEEFFDTARAPGDVSDDGSSYSREHHTVLFNIFVLSQLVNEINSRKVRPEINVFARLQHHALFVGVWLFAVVVQVLMTSFGGDVVKVEPLNAEQWGKCVAVSLLPLVWRFILHLIPASITTAPFGPWFDTASNVVTGQACRRRKKEERETPGNTFGTTSSERNASHK